MVSFQPAESKSFIKTSQKELCFNWNYMLTWACRHGCTDTNISLLQPHAWARLLYVTEKSGSAHPKDVRACPRESACHMHCSCSQSKPLSLTLTHTPRTALLQYIFILLNVKQDLKCSIIPVKGQDRRVWYYFFNLSLNLLLETCCILFLQNQFQHKFLRK